MTPFFFLLCKKLKIPPTVVVRMFVPVLSVATLKGFLVNEKNHISLNRIPRGERLIRFPAHLNVDLWRFSNRHKHRSRLSWVSLERLKDVVVEDLKFYSMVLKICVRVWTMGVFMDVEG